MKTQTVKFLINEVLIKSITIPVSREQSIRSTNLQLINLTENEIKLTHNTDQVKITFVMTERDTRN